MKKKAIRLPEPLSGPAISHKSSSNLCLTGWRLWREADWSFSVKGREFNFVRFVFLLRHLRRALVVVNLG